MKVKRNGQVIEIKDDSELEEGDEKITETQQDKDEKKFTQADVNKFVADEKKKWQKKYEDKEKEFTDYKTEVESERSKSEEKLKGKVEEARKGYPESVVKLLEKQSYAEQLEWIEQNPLEEKNNLPRTPKEKGDGKPVQKPIGTIF
jgi:hypothetical protein